MLTAYTFLPLNIIPTMHLSISTPAKIVLSLLAIIAAVIGFMVKLPSGFRHHDKFLHAAFYFLAALFFNLLFGKGKLLPHVLIFALLFGFGITIEYAQEYSNTLLHQRIHGRFDPEDVQWNLKGLVAFSMLWVPLIAIRALFKASRKEELAK